jgi:hypothetical protein
MTATLTAIELKKIKQRSNKLLRAARLGGVGEEFYLSLGRFNYTAGNK